MNTEPGVHHQQHLVGRRRFAWIATQESLGICSPYVNGQTVRVIVASRNGIKYLKTENDGEQPNNLLSLPECP